MTDKMAVQEVPEAERNWLEGKKIIHAMVKHLEQIEKEEGGSKKLLVDLEAIELSLQTLRLVCMTITFTDFKFAHKNRVLDRLWHVHTLISAEYKRGLQRHRGHGQIVQFRTIEKQYSKHLKTAQYFYKGFVERLSARYRLRSLQRVANSMHSGNLKVDEVIDAEEADLSQELTVACYRTVLHMGDLARYRLNASRQKGHSPDVAMTYYALAQDLMPQEGDAHHQMAVVLADQRRDFDVVYHFLRSWSVKQPFALTPKNLASEFKKLLQPPSTSRKNGNAPPDPYDMFGSWFVRLHANYFKGEEFSSQTELEREVLHRWEALLKKSERPEYLQKAILMNIAAYDIALKKVKSEWTATGSQSCQFILRFIVQTILVLSRVLETETQRLFEEPSSEEEVSRAPTPASKSKPAANAGSENRNHRANGRGRAADSDKSVDKATDKKATMKKSSPSDTCLSLFRVCMAWIAIHQDDLVRFKDYLAPHAADMHRSVTRCLTLFVEIISATDAAPVAYLLPEDVEVIGLAPLDDWTALHENGPSSSFKPHPNEDGVVRKDTTHETLARIYDIIECTVRLVHNPEFPWHLDSVQEEGFSVSKVVFSENYTPMLQTSAPIASSTPSAPSAPSASSAVPVTTASPSTNNAPSRAAPNQAPPAAARSAQSQTTTTNSKGRNRNNKRQQDARKTPQLSSQPQSLPDTVQAKRAARPQAQATAQPTPAQKATSPAAAATVTSTLAQLAPVSTIAMNAATNAASTPRAMTRLPQETPRKASYKDFDNDDDFFVDPNEEPQPRIASVEPASHHAPSESDIDFIDDATYSRLQTPSNIGSALGPTGSSVGVRPIPSSPWNNNRQSNANGDSNSVGYYSAHGPYARPPGLNGTPQSQQQQQQRPHANIEEQLAFLTVNKQNERRFSSGSAAATSPLPMSLAPVMAIPQGKQGGLAGLNAAPARLSSSYGLDGLSRGFPSALSPVGASKQPHSPMGGFTNPWGQAPPASGPPATPSGMLYSSNFSMNSMGSLPPVQGLAPHYQHQHQHQHTSMGGVGAGASAMASSPQGAYGDTYDSIYGSQFPGAAFGNASAAGPPPSVAWQDATTVWGRGSTLARDDPTHFRNAVRNTGLMEDSNAYDRNALMSALRSQDKPQQ
ncbi:telomerase activating protein est1 [Ophiostoma piceae UAMH 11346]|uniref:Nonsense-mediated mRNA decay factor n=1 Tax=Ophiostoma piceae (strain UAMH 11346) TaxID=1262450 RepID=S3C5Z2_OPHP1|nr:telomerase activating protein est1 [Ophiostoma piceae UAMH 11346]